MKGTSQVLRADNFTLPVENKVFVDVPTAIFNDCARRDYRIKVASRRGSAVKVNFERMIGSDDELCIGVVHNSNNLRKSFRTGQAGNAGSCQYAVEKEAIHLPGDCLIPKKTTSPVSSSRTSYASRPSCLTMYLTLRASLTRDMKYLCGTTRVNDLCCGVAVITVLNY